MMKGCCFVRWIARRQLLSNGISRYGFFSNFCFKFFMLMNVKEEKRHILRLCKYMYAREDMQYT